MSADQRPRARDDVVYRELEREWVLFDPVSGRLHRLNLTAALVWDHCRGQLTVAEIAAAVRAAFAQAPDPDAVRGDVEETVARFRSEGLLAALPGP